MFRFSSFLAVLLLASPAFAQSFGALTVTPTHPSPNLQLSWGSGPAGTINVNRAPYTFDNSIAPSSIGTATGTTYLDSTAVANTLYTYTVSQGSSVSNSFLGVVSDLTKPFNCPPMVPVAPALMGVDRTVSFSSANGATTSFTIQAPHGPFTTTTVPPCAGAGGCDDFTNINAAIASSTIIQLSAGDYVFSNINSNTDINIHLLHDVILQGAGFDANGIPLTHLYFTMTTSFPGGVISGVNISSNRILLKNLMIDWDTPNAIPGVVHNFDSTNQHFVVNNPTYYIPNTASLPATSSIVGYHLTNRTYDYSTGARIGIHPTNFNPSYPTGGYFYNIPAGHFPDNTEAVLFITTANAINLADASDVSLENVHIYGGGGPGVQTSRSGNLRLSNVRMTRKPDSVLRVSEQPRYVSMVGDNDSNATNGNTLVENSEVGFMDDDTFHALGISFQPTAVTSTSSITIPVANSPFSGTAGPNNTLVMNDPVTMQPLTSVRPLVTWTVVGPNQILTLTPAIPELAPYVGLASTSLPMMSQPLLSSPNFVFQNSCSHDSHGRVVTNNNNSLVTNNVFGNAYFGPVVADALFPNFQTDQPVPGNAIFSNNKIVGVSYGTQDTDWVGNTTFGLQTGTMAAALSIMAINRPGFVPIGYPNVAFQIYGNFFSNTATMCIFVGGANKVGIVNNICVDSNAVPFQAGYNAAHCGAGSLGLGSLGANYVCVATVAAQGAIMVARSKNVDTTSTANIFLGTSGSLVIDTPTVFRDVILGIVH